MVVYQIVEVEPYEPVRYPCEDRLFKDYATACRAYRQVMVDQYNAYINCEHCFGHYRYDEEQLLNAHYAWAEIGPELRIKELTVE
jgi:hypothetical protein